jgi:nitrate/nitrite-specific signal transduction histidine kinase
VSGRTDELGQLARVFERMAREIYQRVEKLKEQVSLLKIEIDEARKERQVAEIVGSDFFSELQTKARSMRERKQQGEAGTPAPDKPKRKSKKDKE